MNFYLEALQDEHLLLENALDGYCADALAAALKIRTLLNQGTADRIVFCGMGSSLYAAYSVVAKLNNGGIRTEARNCFEMLSYANGCIDKKTILIMISQSGNTPEAVQLMERIRKNAAFTISMVNNEDGRLLGMADLDIFLKIGKETHISNKTYYAQVAQLNLIAGAILSESITGIAESIRRAVRWHGDYVAQYPEKMLSIIDFFNGVDFIDLLGDDAQLGVAMQGGLVLREMTLRNFCAHSLSDYNHGWFEIARPGYLMVIFADRLSGNDYKMIDFCLEHGGKAMVLSSCEVGREHERLLKIKIPDEDCELLPMYSIVPCYFAAGMLAVVGR